jgi:hypothetical protein
MQEEKGFFICAVPTKICVQHGRFHSPQTLAIGHMETAVLTKACIQQIFVSSGENISSPNARFSCASHWLSALFGGKATS